MAIIVEPTLKYTKLQKTPEKTKKRNNVLADRNFSANKYLITRVLFNLRLRIALYVG